MVCRLIYTYSASGVKVAIYSVSDVKVAICSARGVKVAIYSASGVKVAIFSVVRAHLLVTMSSHKLIGSRLGWGNRDPHFSSSLSTADIEMTLPVKQYSIGCTGCTSYTVCAFNTVQDVEYMYMSTQYRMWSTCTC